VFRNQGSGLFNIIPTCFFCAPGLGLDSLKPGFETFAKCQILLKSSFAFFVIWLGFVICIFGRLGFHVLKPGFGPPGLGFETFADKPRTPAPKKSDQPLSPNPDRFRAYTSNPDCPTNLNLRTLVAPKPDFRTLIVGHRLECHLPSFF